MVAALHAHVGIKRRFRRACRWRLQRAEDPPPGQTVLSQALRSADANDERLPSFHDRAMPRLPGSEMQRLRGYI